MPQEAGTLVALPEPERPPQPRKNMVWIAPGAFVAGTPVHVLPRLADQEMPGVQVVMHGYYIDQYPFPNEPGAIQTTNLTRDEARARCEALGKRLCTELEWERACKGPQSTLYEYGDSYRADDCGVSTAARLMPSGTRVGCRSSFDVYDLHGGAFEWTSSPWGRGSNEPLAAVRGGGGEPGEVVGRCANAVPRNPEKGYADVGFRCCAGEVNDAEVTLQIRKPAESWKPVPLDSKTVQQLESHLPSELAAMVPAQGRGAFKIRQAWAWYPIGNEEIVAASGCAHPGVHSICGVVFGRVLADAVAPLAFAPSGWWLPNIQLDDDRRILWVYGGDGTGKYRRQVAHLWGRVGVGQPERPGQATPRKRKKRRTN